MLPLRWITRQTSGWWRTWTPWMTTWLRFSTRPLTSLSLSSGGTVSWEDVHFERDCCLSGGVVWCGNIFHVDFPVSSWLSFFFFIVCCVDLCFCLLKSHLFPSISSSVHSHFCLSFSCFTGSQRYRIVREPIFISVFLFYIQTQVTRFLFLFPSYSV